MARYDKTTRPLYFEDDIMFCLGVVQRLAGRLAVVLNNKKVPSAKLVEVILVALNFFTPVPGKVYGFRGTEEATFKASDFPACSTGAAYEFTLIYSKLSGSLLGYLGKYTIWSFCLQTDLKSENDVAMVRAQLALALKAGVEGFLRLIPGPLKSVVAKRRFELN